MCIFNNECPGEEEYIGNWTSSARGDWLGILGCIECCSSITAIDIRLVGKNSNTVGKLKNTPSLFKYYLFPGWPE